MGRGWEMDMEMEMEAMVGMVDMLIEMERWAWGCIYTQICC